MWCSECQVGNNGDVTVGCGIGVIWVEDEGAEIVSGSKSSIGVGGERRGGEVRGGVGMRLGVRMRMRMGRGWRGDGEGEVENGERDEGRKMVEE